MVLARYWTCRLCNIHRTQRCLDTLLRHVGWILHYETITGNPMNFYYLGSSITKMTRTSRYRVHSFGYDARPRWSSGPTTGSTSWIHHYPKNGFPDLNLLTGLLTLTARSLLLFDFGSATVVRIRCVMVNFFSCRVTSRSSKLCVIINQWRDY